MKQFYLGTAGHESALVLSAESRTARGWNSNEDFIANRPGPVFYRYENDTLSVYCSSEWIKPNQGFQGIVIKCLSSPEMGYFEAYERYRQGSFMLLGAE